MKAIRINLTFFFDETRIREHDLKARLEKLLADEFPEVRDRDVHYQDGPFAAPEDLMARLERLDT